jgi:S1-C subfamily serine protease
MHRLALSIAVGFLVAGCTGQEQSGSARILEAAVHVEATGCGQATKLGGGSVIAENRVVTVAHTVAGATDISVIAADGQRYGATVVGIDRHKDLALLAIDATSIAPLPLATMGVDDSGQFVVFREGDPLLTPFVTRRKVDIKMDSIDEDGVSLRHGYQIEAAVVSGDSGAVLVFDGAATAVIFAHSRGVENRVWATDISEIEPLLKADTGRPVARGECSEFA